MSEPAVFSEIRSTIEGNDVVLFMKGVRAMPQCGFSNLVVRVLDHLGVDYKDVNVLADPEVREGIKAFSDWPAFAVQRGLAFLGIEAMTGAKRTGPPTLGDVWRFARSLRRGATKPSDRTPEQALAAALAVPGMTSVLVTTTSPAHLAASLAVAGLDGGAARA